MSPRHQVRSQTRRRRLSSLAAVLTAIGMLLSVVANAEPGRNVTPHLDLIDTGLVRESVTSTVKALNDSYVYPEAANRIGAEMLKRLEDGRYDQISTKQEFAERIGAELREISGDGHLSIMLRVAGEEPTHVITETVDRLRLNYGFQHVEILEGNIGYLKFNKFYLDEEAQTTADYALGFLGGSDALIIDLTECVGGSPELVRHMLSYFFADETVLWRIINRDGETTYEAVSTVGLGSERFKRDFPLYVLTSPDTASGAELFAYTLRSYSKAQTVGQRTMGIAHAVGAIPINDHFVGRFSTYRNANAVTKTNWEGVGLEPDVPATLEDSLATAIRLASDRLERPD